MTDVYADNIKTALDNDQPINVYHLRYYMYYIDVDDWRDERDDECSSFCQCLCKKYQRLNVFS